MASRTNLRAVNVAEFIVRALRDQGIDHLFMDPGGLNDAFMTPMTGNTNAIAHSNRQIFRNQNPKGSARFA